MVPRDDKNVKCKYCNTIDRICYPVCCGITDEPFGYEMRFGRGVCDTDPIPKYEFKKSCKTEDHKSVITATINIEDVALDTYFKDGQKPLGPEQQDLRKENKVAKQLLKDLPIEDQKKPREKLVDQSNRNSSEGSRRPDLPNAFNVSMHSSMEYNHFSKISRTTDKESLERKLQGKKIQLAGPFTEPLNPGRQMKLGKPYHVHCRVGKDFYKDF